MNIDCKVNLLKKSASKKLLTYDELPEWYQDNENLVCGYRPCNQSFCYYLKSVIKIHNEFVNIITHLIPAIIFFILIIYSNIIRMVGDNIGDNIALNIFLFSEFLCFFLSSIMHTFYPYSEKVCNILIRLDYFGISLSILGFYTIFIYYAFYCHEAIQIAYYSVSYTLGIITIVTNCFSRFAIPICYKTVRAMVFFGFCASILIPLFHRIIEDYDNEPAFTIEFKYSTLTGILVGLSLFFYITQIPEKYTKQKVFNYIFTSHQIFHVLSFSGIFLFYMGLFDIYHQHEELDCSIISQFL